MIISGPRVPVQRGEREIKGGCPRVEKAGEDLPVWAGVA
jgi:hypothetical protein